MASVRELIPLAWRVWLRRDARHLPTRAASRLRGAPPLPPPELLYLVGGNYDPRQFLANGATAAAALRETLAEAGRPFEGFASVLDFGCGCGRVIRHFLNTRGPRLHGTDYNPRLVGWCARHLPAADFKLNPPAGPLPYPADSFDLVYSYSVFTHLSEPSQRLWMDELRRVLRPGGLLYLTLHGRGFADSMGERERADFDAGRLAIRDEDREGTNYCAAYHPEPYVRGPLSRGFSVVAFKPQAARGGSLQDAWLLRKT